MDSISLLLISAFFSLHQYIPQEEMNAKYFETVIDPITLDANKDSVLILAAASESCRYLFKSAQQELDFTPEQLHSFAFSLVDKENESLLVAGTSAPEIKKLISQLCIEDFNPQNFSENDRTDIQSFIKNKISVLTKKDLEAFGNYKHFGQTQLYDASGKSLGALFSNTGQWTSISSVAPSVSQALIAAEDAHFLKHDGVYLGSLVRMAYDLKTTNSSSEIAGGSTITMQLLKNLYFNNWPEPENSLFSSSRSMRTILRKVREWYWAKTYENYSARRNPSIGGKQIVLENYLNLMDYGPGIRGIDYASETFFSKEPSQINIPEAAFLASLFKRPNSYSLPKNYKVSTIKRRRYVLEQMNKLNWEDHLLDPISAEQQNDALATPLPDWTASYQTTTPLDTSAFYLKAYARDFLLNHLNKNKGEFSLESELQTTVNLDLQKIVFDTTRARLDAYDAERQQQSRIAIARDDRSNVPVASGDDVDNDVKSLLYEFQNSLNRSIPNTHIVIYLGYAESGKESKKSFYHLDPKTSPEFLSDELQQELNRSLNTNAKAVGQVLIYRFIPNTCGLPASSFEITPSILELKNTDTGKDSTETLLPFTLENAEALPPAGTFDNSKVANSGDAGVRPRPRPASFTNNTSERWIFSPKEEDSSGCVQLLGEKTLTSLSLFNDYKKIEDVASSKITSSFLNRMADIVPRPHFVPAIIDGRLSSDKNVLAILKNETTPQNTDNSSNNSYHDNLRSISITSDFKNKNHAALLNKKISSGEFKIGQVVWVAQQGVEFYLETPPLQSAVVVLDSETGDVLATFGGYNPESSRDRSRQAKRPPGSTLKPWLYYLALQKGFTPQTIIKNRVAFPLPNGKAYNPRNYDGATGEAEMSLTQALTESWNKAAVGILTDDRFGPTPKDNLIEYVQLLTDVGIYNQNTVLIYPSIVLGTQDANVLDLVRSFSFFANGQKIVNPLFFKTLVDGRGDVLIDHESHFTEVPYSNNKAQVEMIQKLLIETANFGTAAALSDFPSATLGLNNCNGQSLGINGQICFGGKTGTSDDSHDNWFVGFSKRFVIGVWIGYDHPESTGATGGALALPLFMDIVKNGQSFLPPIEPIISASLPSFDSIVNEPTINGTPNTNFEIPNQDLPFDTELSTIPPNIDFNNSPTAACHIHESDFLVQCASQCLCQERFSGVVDLIMVGQFTKTWETNDSQINNQSCEQEAIARGCQ